MIVRYIWALFDNANELFDVYGSREEAEDDAVGPRFHPKYTVRVYELVPRKEEPQ